jgi:hypothetical protein
MSEGKVLYIWTTGEMLDNIEDGQIADTDDCYVIKRKGNIYFGTDENVHVTLSASFLTRKWRLTEFYEDRLCQCCDAPLKHGTPQYAEGRRAPNGNREYYLAHCKERGVKP